MNFSTTKRPKNDLIKYYVNLKKYKEKNGTPTNYKQ